MSTPAQAALSTTMQEVVDRIRQHGSTITRYPGGFWCVVDASKNIVYPTYGTTTVQALVRRGVLEYSLWKETYGGRRFPIEARLGASSLERGDDRREPNGEESMTPEARNALKEDLMKWAALAQQDRASALPPPEPHGHCERSRLATCSLPVSSAERLIAAWRDRARFARQAADSEAGTEREFYWKAKAEAYRLCAEDLRRHAGLPAERQPEENVRDEPRGK